MTSDKLYKQAKYNYQIWKTNSIRTAGFFLIFNGFLDNEYLKHISGGALKLYVFLGIKSNNLTGESFYSLESIANYFDVSQKTISNWFKELINLRLVYRYQLKFNGVSHSILRPYQSGVRGDH